MLERFRKAKEGEIARLRKLADTGKLPAPKRGERPGFAASLKKKPGVAVIAEYKRASPSRGDINLALSPGAAAAAYAAAGAGALSVLTESEYFKGSIAFLEAMSGPGLPLLRKDFIFHPVQVDATAATPASAVLVIVRTVDDAALRALLGRARDFGLEAVVEVFDEGDLNRAKEAGAAIIQVNNRDLGTLRVNPAVSRNLIPRKENGELWISASGVREKTDLDLLRDLGFDAALVGTSLMEGADPGSRLAALLGGSRA